MWGVSRGRGRFGALTAYASTVFGTRTVGGGGLQGAEGDGDGCTTAGVRGVVVCGFVQPQAAGAASGGRRGPGCRTGSRRRGRL